MIPNRVSSPLQAESETNPCRRASPQACWIISGHSQALNPLASWHGRQAVTPACRDETKGGGGERPLRLMTKISAEKGDELSLFTENPRRVLLGNSEGMKRGPGLQWGSGFLFWPLSTLGEVRTITAPLQLMPIEARGILRGRPPPILPAPVFVY